MSSLDRLHKFAALLCEAIPDIDIGSLSPRPLDDPGARTHVGRLTTQSGESGMRVLYAVSDSSKFVPIAFTTCEDTEVAVSLAQMLDFVGDRPAPPVGASFDMDKGGKLARLDLAGAVLLKPNMLAALSAFEDGVAKDGEVFEPRLVVYVNAADLATALDDFPALMNRFNATGRSVFLSR
jgi:hypothetical protein